MPEGAGNAIDKPVVPNINSELSPDRSEEPFSPLGSVFGDLMEQAHEWEVRDQAILVPNTQEQAPGESIPLPAGKRDGLRPSRHTYTRPPPDGKLSSAP